MKPHFLLFFFIQNFAFSQTSILAKYEARYELNYKPSKQSDFKLKNTFILLMNEKESFLQNMSHYVMDSLEKAGKLKKTGNMQTDIANYAKYAPELPYKIYTRNGTLKYLDSPNSRDQLFVYSESPKFNWVITRETKKISGVDCIKATTHMWGRKWLAYYSPKHPLPFGPYKFGGLPGLIFMIYDEADEYNFKLYRYSKRNNLNYTINIDAKTISKKEYNTLKTKADADIDNMGIDFSKMDLKSKNQLIKTIQNNVKNKNHLEINE
ncbi:MAG: GLPGLI family protein [Leadbetterella sp.]|nr:GLPGLI family protein [Leadbetterella sp.]